MTIWVLYLAQFLLCLKQFLCWPPSNLNSSIVPRFVTQVELLWSFTLDFSVLIPSHHMDGNISQNLLKFKISKTCHATVAWTHEPLAVIWIVAPHKRREQSNRSHSVFVFMLFFLGLGMNVENPFICSD